MERTMIQLLKLTASKLHNRKLKGLTGEELSGLLGEVQARFHLDNVDEESMSQLRAGMMVVAEAERKR